uniref:DUF4340 domain-containing protein n=1 Tax=Candidatus Kentrum sp. MB TaxID=2138164 RepID=A0A450XYR7_9GAMM|nr:MAG: protein of unknown function (DUF4340) [Candidatus Kentron sp. MB]VFK34406.1 MAG: protein of unknown function (DUF4340) [Candidatus Kentron sp. MB]VFK76713.1 MAG: protein of unknown function (DUF4340) [Candidatus Kentron sp. MB]
MNKPGNFLLLAAITVVVVFAAIHVQRGPEQTATQQTLLFPELHEKLNRAAHIRLARGESVIQLHRQKEGAWGVPARANYPAALDKIHELLLGTARLQRLEQKTSNPERYHRLGLTETRDDSNHNGGALRITIQDQQKETLADLFLGKRSAAKGRRGREEMYARLPDDPTVWLVEGNLPYADETTDWLQENILTFDQARIRAVHITHPDGEQVIVQRVDPKATDYQLIDLPEGAKPKSTYVINGIASDMANLRLQDVRALKELDLSSGKPGAQILLTTFDGMRITMKTQRTGQETLARFEAGFDAALVYSEPEIEPSQPEKAEAGEPGKDAAQDKKTQPLAIQTPSDKPEKRRDADTVKKEAELLSAKWRDWAYILSEHHLNNLTKRISDLIEKPADSAAKENGIGESE